MLIRKRLSVVLLIVLMLSASFSALAATPRAMADGTDELLLNAGFESVANGAPTQWRQFNTSLPVTSSTYRTYEGASSVKLDDPSLQAQPHITNGCYRLHPVEWNIGEAAGYLAGFCLDRGVRPRDVRNRSELLEEYQRLLVREGIELAWPTVG